MRILPGFGCPDKVLEVFSPMDRKGICEVGRGEVSPQYVGVLSTAILLPVCAERYGDQRICAGRYIAAPQGEPGWYTNGWARCYADDAIVSLQRGIAFVWIYRCHRRAGRSAYSGGIQAWAARRVAQRCYSTVCPGTLPGRKAARRGCYPLRLHLLRRVAPAGTGGFQRRTTGGDAGGHLSGALVGWGAG